MRNLFYDRVIQMFLYYISYIFQCYSLTWYTLCLYNIEPLKNHFKITKKIGLHLKVYINIKFSVSNTFCLLMFCLLILFIKIRLSIKSQCCFERYLNLKHEGNILYRCSVLRHANPWVWKLWRMPWNYSSDWNLDPRR